MVTRWTMGMFAGVLCLGLSGCNRNEAPARIVSGTGRNATTTPGMLPTQTHTTSTLPLRLQLGTPEQNSILVCEFLAGTGFTPEEAAVVRAEDAADRRRNPQSMVKADSQVKAILQRAQRATPLQEATTRELLMNAIFSQSEMQIQDPRSMAIVRNHNRVLATSAASKTALTERSLRGILDEVQTMDAYQGRPPLAPATMATFAAALLREYASAPASKQVLMANADSQAIALHMILQRFTAADRARYQRTASVGAVTPEMLEQAAEATLLKADATAAARRTSDAAFLRQQQALINEEFRIGVSPLLPH